MNEWVSKSIKIANSSGYLDRLHEIYPVVHEAERKVTKELEAQLKRVYDKDDDVALVKELLKLEKFPIKDPYVAFLRKKDAFIGYNPETVARIAKRIRDMGFQEMMRSIKEPKEFNRQIGPLFKRWIHQIGYPVLAEAEFKEYDQDVAFLQGDDRQLQNFANDISAVNLQRDQILSRGFVKNSWLERLSFLPTTVVTRARNSDMLWSCLEERRAKQSGLQCLMGSCGLKTVQGCTKKFPC